MKIPIFKEFEWFEWFVWFGPSPIEPFNSGANGERRRLRCEGRGYVDERPRGQRRRQTRPHGGKRGALAIEHVLQATLPPEERLREDPAQEPNGETLVERFDIEPFPDFSAK